MSEIPAQPEQSEIKLGYIALNDCVPLVVAQELGFFSEQGLSVTLMPQNSWSTLRDRVLSGDLDGAQMLAPMPFASNQRLGRHSGHLVTALTLSRNGNAITLSERLIQEFEERRGAAVGIPMAAAALEPLFEDPSRQLTLASVHPHSCHQLLLHYWLRSLPKALQERCRLLVIPPIDMLEALRSGRIDGYCVGGPWNAAAVREGVGLTIATSLDLMPDHPEKVLGVTRAWHQRNPGTHAALIRALLQSLRWLDSLPNRFEAARLLAVKGYVEAPLDALVPSLIDSCLVRSGVSPRRVAGYHRFYGGDCTRPDVAQGLWLARQMNEAGLLQEPVSETQVGEVYLDSFYLQVANL